MQTAITRETTGDRDQARGGGRLGAWLLTAGAVLSVPVGVAASIAPSIGDSTNASAFLVSGLVLTIAHALVLAGVALLIRAGLAGRGPLAGVAVAVALLALAGQVVAEAALRVDFATGSNLFGVDTPVLALGMILLGIAIIRAGAWTGWRRFVALAWGIYIPVVLVPSFIVAKGPNFVALTVMSLIVLAFGVAAIQESARTER